MSYEEIWYEAESGKIFSLESQMNCLNITGSDTNPWIWLIWVEPSRGSAEHEARSRDGDKKKSACPTRNKAERALTVGSFSRPFSRKYSAFN